MNNEMDDSIVRNISNDTIQKVVGNLNSDFIKDLPASPEEIAKHAIRRTHPVISNSISYPLGQAMLANRMSDEEYLLAFYQAIHSFFAGKKATDNPSAYMLVSQTGAGKTNLTSLILRNNPNTIVVNPDLHKKFNPKLETILKEDPTHLGALTGIDSYDHAKSLQRFAIDKGFNLLYECAPSEKAGLLGVDMQTLEEQEYNIEYHILAIGNLISSMAVHLRYERDITENPTSTSTKLTDLGRHDDSYKGVETVVKKLHSSNEVSVYRRGNKEEAYIPQAIGKIKSANPQEIMGILEKERKRSNKAYVFDSAGSFQEDFNKIKVSMQQRGAPEAQLKQLNEIYDRYIMYLHYIKYKESGFDNTDI